MNSITRQNLKRLILRSPLAFRMYWRWKGYGPKSIPEAPWYNAVLKTDKQLKASGQQIKKLRLIAHSDPNKNWDTLAMLDCILKNTQPDDCILDAGAEYYSCLLPNLSLYGYKRLFGINLSFQENIKVGPISYERGNITNTRFANDTFSAIACQSVIEHGVDIEDFFREMSRILKPNGLLITSCDYYIDPIDTKGKQAYGHPITIFNKDTIIETLQTAARFKLLPLDAKPDFTCEEKPVHWLELDYTFIIFTLKKTIA